MMKYRTRKIIKDKNRKKLEKSSKKQLFGENFIQDSTIKMATIFKNHYKVQHKKQESQRRHQMIIYYKFEMERNMDSISTKNITVKSDS